jgi:HK97 family phage prohead protease
MDCQLVGVAATLNTLLPPRRPGDRPQRFHRDAFSRLIEDERHVDVLLLHDWDQVVTTPENLHLWLKPDGLHFQCWPEKTVAGWRAVLGVQSGRFVGVSVRGEERRETVGGVDVIREIRLHEISLVILPHDSKTSVRYLSAEQAEKERQQRLSRLYRR